MGRLDFSIDPAYPAQGLQFFGQQMSRRQEHQRAAAKEKQEQQKRQKAYNLMKTGTREQIEEFITTTPGAQKIFDEAISFKSESTKRDYLETARKIYLEGAEAAPALMERGQAVMQEGGDATETLEVAEQAIQDPNKGKEWAMRVFQVYEPDTYKRIVGKAANMPKHQKTGAFLIKDETGKTSIAVGDYDPATGSLKTVTGDIEGEVVSKLGETATEQTERIVGQKRKEKAVAGEESRASALIEDGVSAAQSTATLRRGIELLSMVKTGGFAAASQKAKQIFGIESANEGELSNSLSKAVLSQLRETFGAAFTAQEGRQLTNIEAKFSKSAEANKRLLSQALKIAERKAKRARAAALKRGDQATVDDIDDLLTFSLSMESPEKKEAQIELSPSDTTPEQYEQLPSGATYSFGGKTYRKK